MNGIDVFILLIGFTYSLNIQRLPTFRITDGEIFDLVDELRRNDVNKAKDGQIKLNFQGHTSTGDSSDQASLK